MTFPHFASISVFFILFTPHHKKEKLFWYFLHYLIYIRIFIETQITQSLWCRFVMVDWLFRYGYPFLLSVCCCFSSTDYMFSLLVCFWITFRDQLHKNVMLLLMGSCCLSMLLVLIVVMFQFGDGLHVKRIYVGWLFVLVCKDLMRALSAIVHCFLSFANMNFAFFVGYYFICSS